jgi:hypothetical protein
MKDEGVGAMTDKLKLAGHYRIPAKLTYRFYLPAAKLAAHLLRF